MSRQLAFTRVARWQSAEGIAPFRATLPSRRATAKLRLAASPSTSKRRPAKSRKVGFEHQKSKGPFGLSLDEFPTERNETPGTLRPSGFAPWIQIFRRPCFDLVIALPAVTRGVLRRKLESGYAEVLPTTGPIPSGNSGVTNIPVAPKLGRRSPRCHAPLRAGPADRLALPILDRQLAFRNSMHGHAAPALEIYSSAPRGACRLLDRHRFGQIARLVHIGAARHGGVIGK